MQPATGAGVACKILDGADFPSWQSPRCGLPATMHANPDASIMLTEWLEAPGRFFIDGTTQPISCEAGLKHLLMVACLLNDLESIEREDWGAADQLQDSSLRYNEEDLKLLIVQWASQSAAELDDVLAHARGDGVEDVDMEVRGSEPGPSAPAGPDNGTAGPVEGPAGLESTSRAPTPPPRHDKGKGRAYDPPRTNDAYMEAAQDIHLPSLKRLLSQATSGPGDLAEEQARVAVERFTREEDQGTKNLLARQQSRKRNEELYGSKTKPVPRPQPQMATPPALPPVVDLPIPLETPHRTPAPVAKRRKRAGPTEVQDMAFVADLEVAPRATRSGTRARGRGGATRTVKQPAAARAVRKPSTKKLPPRKRPKPSEAKRAQDSESDGEASTTSGSDSVSAEEVRRVPPSPVRTRSVRKRGRRNTVTDPGSMSDPPMSPPARPPSKRQRVDLHLDRMKPVSFVAGSSRPKPRPVFRPNANGKKAVETRALRSGDPQT